MYRLSNSGEIWKNGVIGLPRTVVDQYLHLASGEQLKLLLFLLGDCARAYSAAELAAALHMDERLVRDHMEFWIAQGVLCEAEDGQTAAPAAHAAPARRETAKPEMDCAQEVPENSNEAKPPKEKIRRLSAPRLTPKDVLRRMEEDAGIRALLNEAQQVFGRTISHGEQEMLVNMVDYYGLTAEVILMLLDYARSAKKMNTRYITSVGRNWAEEGVDTVEEAERKLNEICAMEPVWDAICEAGDLPKKPPTPLQRECAKRWSREWGMPMDVIARAFEIARENEVKRAVPYVNKILQNWHEENLTTLEAVLEREQPESPAEKKRSVRAPGKKGHLDSNPSYDLDEMERISILETLNFGGE
ncbi:MAG: DnaD domain protein [Clostridiales bacterium]|nr:DnaD domain protein [Clostridiales bacterium]